MPLTDLEAREELRYAVRRYLAARPTAALTLDMIAHGLRGKGIGADSSDMLTELIYWTGTEPPHVKVILPHAHGTTRAFQITSAGRLADERGE